MEVVDPEPITAPGKIHINVESHSAMILLIKVAVVGEVDRCFDQSVGLADSADSLTTIHKVVAQVSNACCAIDI